MKHPIITAVGAVALMFSSLSHAFSSEDLEDLINAGRTVASATTEQVCDVIYCSEALESRSGLERLSATTSDELEDAAEDAENILSWLNEQATALWDWIIEDLLGMIRDILNN